MSAGGVAMMNGNGGVWSIVSVTHCLLVGRIFTGAEGGWSSFVPERGADATGRKHDHETFFGNFVKAQNGKYYTVAGKGFWGICRIEGLDDYQVEERRLKVTAEALAANQALRPAIAATAKALKTMKKGGGQLTVQRLAKRTKDFKLDGVISEWGDVAKMQMVGKSEEKLRFDAAYDDEGLYVAYSGLSYTGNKSDDWRFIFKTGFCFDVMVRTNTASGAAQVIAGDRRIVFGKHKGQWIAVLYDYVDAKARPEESVEFASPLLKTKVARVAQLPVHAFKVAMKESATAGAGGRIPWTAEAFVKWSELGIAPAANVKFRADFGILSADSGGVQVDRRAYWSDPATEHVADLAVEAQIHPGAWGTITLAP